MRQLFRQLDQILRGEATRMEVLRSGRIEVPAGGMAVVTALLAVGYGLCMGAFGVIRTGGAEREAYYQLLAGAAKLPLLFFLTLLVTFPSLYVFNALVGSRLSIIAVLRLLIASLGVMLAVLASLGPIVVFFSISTTSYPFMVLLNVAMCTVAGLLGLAFLLRTLHRLVIAEGWHAPLHRPAPLAPPIQPGEAEDDVPLLDDAGESAAQASTGEMPPTEQAPDRLDLDRSPLDRTGGYTHRRAHTVFRIWVVVFALVGAQMSWILRPFIGKPGLPFEWFREREGNFFEAVLQSFARLLGF